MAAQGTWWPEGAKEGCAMPDQHPCGGGIDEGGTGIGVRGDARADADSDAASPGRRTPSGSKAPTPSPFRNSEAWSEPRDCTLPRLA